MYLDRIGHAYAESTAKSNKYKWTKFVEFHNAHKLQLVPPKYQNIARFLTHYSTTVTSFQTVMNMLSSIKTFYSLIGYNINVQHPVIDLYVKASRRTMSTQSHPKSPIQPAHLVLLPSVLTASSPLHAAFYAAILVQFFTCLRKSNLLPASRYALKSHMHLKRSDIIFTQDAMILVLPWTKTLQNKDNILTLAIAKIKGAVIDPVATYQKFVAENPVPPNYPAFAYRQANQICILTQQVYIDILKQSLEKLGIPSASYSSHSIRRGATSLLFEQGLEIDLIKLHGTWKSDAYTKYLTFNHAQRLKPSKIMYKHFNDNFGHL